jgi:hypothetical protein
MAPGAGCGMYAAGGTGMKAPGGAPNCMTGYGMYPGL